MFRRLFAVAFSAIILCCSFLSIAILAGNGTASAAPIVADGFQAQAAAERTTDSWQTRAPEFQHGESQGIQIAEGGISLAAGGSGYQGQGEYLSPVHVTSLQFDDAVLSWNAETPSATHLRLELRVQDQEGWSGWYAMGEMSAEGGNSVRNQKDDRGFVDIDTLKLKRPAQALQYRVTMSTDDTSVSPLVRLVSVVYSDQSVAPAGPQLSRIDAAVRDLDVPRHSQLSEDPAIAGKICSATSLAMVMQYWGSTKSVAEVAAGIRDRTTGIFGDWPLNTAYAGAHGLEARVDRFYSVEQLEQEIAEGRPAIISIAFEPGELAGSPIQSTDGHLIVVRGFTSNGDVIVNDPIAPTDQGVRLVYKRDQLGGIWLRSGGVVYLVTPRK